MGISKTSRVDVDIHLLNAALSILKTEAKSTQKVSCIRLKVENVCHLSK